LLDAATSWHSEFELGLDLLWNGSELVLIEPDICSVERLEDHVASVRGWLSRVAVKLQGVRGLLVWARLIASELLLSFSALGRWLLALSSFPKLREGFRLVTKRDARWSSEEGIRDLDLKELGLHCNWLAALGVG
jgi:hypothetical protein